MTPPSTQNEWSTELPAQDHIETEWGADSEDFELPAKACDLSGEGDCEACQ
jgi:hypothetical protein